MSKSVEDVCHQIRHHCPKIKVHVPGVWNHDQAPRVISLVFQRLKSKTSRSQGIRVLFWIPIRYNEETRRARYYLPEPKRLEIRPLRHGGPERLDNGQFQWPILVIANRSVQIRRFGDAVGIKTHCKGLAKELELTQVCHIRPKLSLKLEVHFTTRMKKIFSKFRFNFRGW